VGQIHEEHVDLAPYAADIRDRFTEVDLGMSRWVRKRNKLLCRAPARFANVNTGGCFV
jgi:hypothetical protein